MKWASCLPKWGNVLAHHGQRACPCWADLLSDKCPISSYCNTHIPVSWILPTQAIPVVWIPHTWESFSSDNSFHLIILFISKPSRQLPDNRKTVNYLSIRILRRKTRQSDSFWEILGFTKNQRYWQLLIISISLNPNKKGLDNRRFSASPIIQSLFYVQTRGLNGMFLNVTSRASYRSSHRCQGEEHWLTYPCSDRR